MSDIQTFEELYVDLCEQVAAKMPAINWQDLWHEQVSFLDTEHPWEGNAIFYEFRGVDSADLSQLAQAVDLQVDVYLFYETFLDTAHGSYNQEDALLYLRDLSTLNSIFHGYSSDAIDGMRRVSFGRVETGGAGNLYRVTFMGQTRDHSAVKMTQGVVPGDAAVSEGERPERELNNNFMIQ